jgi:hypothetical protein
LWRTISQYSAIRVVPSWSDRSRCELGAMLGDDDD